MLETQAGKITGEEFLQLQYLLKLLNCSDHHQVKLGKCVSTGRTISVDKDKDWKDYIREE